MAGKTVNLTPETELVIEKMSIRMQKARSRRNILADVLAEHAGISKGTLTAIERGESTVSIGAYAAVLNALGMANDLELVAVIAAAIAASEGASSTDGFVVRSIKRIR